MSRSTPIISVAGRPKVGKTTFLVKLIAELDARGYRVGVIKHSVHPFDFSQPGKDTWKHAQAGAQAVAFVSPHQVALLRKVEQEMALEDAVALLGEVDLILTEGYKHAATPKIEVSRCALGRDLVCRREEIVAVVADHQTDLDVPHFDLDDAAGVADLIEQRFLGQTPTGAADAPSAP